MGSAGGVTPGPGQETETVTMPPRWADPAKGDDTVTATVRLGRLAGVDIGAHWSVLIIFGLLAWSLSASRFPAEYPGNPPWAYIVAGVGAAVVFLLGLLAHEVSHAVVAMRNGLAVG